MILGNLDKKIYKLNDSIKVKDFISNIIENDNDKCLRYYTITLKSNVSGKNMVLYYQNNVLKSHHTSHSAMDYSDYLEYEIFEHYGSDYISSENIISFNKDYIGDDVNKPKPNINKPINPKELNELFENIKLEDDKQQLLNKVQYDNLDELNLVDVIKCVREMLDIDFKRRFNEHEKDRKIEFMESDINKLKERIKWLEYKIWLLQNNNNY